MIELIRTIVDRGTRRRRLIIEAVLSKNKDKQLNLTSAACRQALAREIAEELEKVDKA